jgi:hypothetical protein
MLETVVAMAATVELAPACSTVVVVQEAMQATAATAVLVMDQAWLP